MNCIESPNEFLQLGYAFVGFLAGFGARTLLEIWKARIKK